MVNVPRLFEEEGRRFRQGAGRVLPTALSRARSLSQEVCTTSGRKIRSGGRGRGLVIGRGLGPIGRMR